MDGQHGNAYAEWLSMDSPQQPSAEQYSRLEQASALPRVHEARREVVSGSVVVEFALPRQGVALVRVGA